MLLTTIQTSPTLILKNHATVSDKFIWSFSWAVTIIASKINLILTEI